MAREADSLEDTFDKNDELRVAAENERQKIVDLREVISYLHKENVMYKQKYNDLKERLSYLTNLLENNVKAFNQLFGDASAALQIGRLSILNSPSSPKNTFLSRLNHVTPTSVKNPQPHRKLHIEPLNIEEIITEVEHANRIRKPEDSINASGSPANEGLSVIYEEDMSEIRDAVMSEIRDVVVRLSRLPNEIIQKHLPQTPLSSNTSLNITDLFSPNMRLPSFTSTPSKLEAMQQLGLIPSRTENENCPNNFVSTRRRGNGTVTIKTRDSSVGFISPKKERKSSRKISLVSPKVERDVKPLANSVSPKNNKKKKKEPAAVSAVQSKRPPRKAKPMALKEESLRKKKRRD